MIRKKKTVLGLAVAASTALILSACGGGDSDDSAGVGFEDCEENPDACNEEERVEGGKVTGVIDSGWTSWNNNRAGERNVYVSQAMAGVFPETTLFKPSGEWEHNPAVFSDEAQMVSEDPLTVEYYLNPDGNWGDGTPITVDDFIYNWYSWSGDPDLCDPDLCVPASTSYGGHVESIEETEENVITITYEEGHQDPEWQFNEVITFPAHIIEENGFEDWQDDPTVMGESTDYHSENYPTWTSGPYRITDASEGEFVLMERNEDFAGDTEVTLDEIELQVIEDMESIVTEMRQGSVQFASPASIDPDQMDQIETLEETRYHVGPGPSWTHIDINTNNEFLQDVALREAFFTAIDVEGIIDRTFGLAVDDVERKTNHIFMNDDDYHVDVFEDSPQGSGDLDEARQILEEAGYEWDDSDNLLTPDGEQVEFNFRAAVDDTIRSDTAEIVQQQVTELGIDLELVSIAAGDLSTVNAESNFDVIIFGWSGSPTFTNAPRQYWHSTSDSNYGNLESDEVDDRIAQISTTNDIDEAAQYTNDVLEALVDEAYYLPIVDAPVVIMADESLTGVRDNPNSSNRGLYAMEEWGYTTEEEAEASLGE